MHGLITISICLAWGHHLVFGPHGVKDAQVLHKQIIQENKRIRVLQNDISNIKQDLATWEDQQDLFEKERVAREDFLLSYTNERVYFVQNKKEGLQESGF